MLEMGGCRCSYKNCANTTKTSENLHFFHYPVKHRERCVQWIENACKPNFYDLEEEQLRNKVVCEMHFELKWFPNTQKKRLLQGAVPTLDGKCNDVNPPMSPMETDGPMYLPTVNQYSDVKVVPANDEGTVFVLDTENMFTRSSKIESYIIKNGVLVPTNSNCNFGRSTKQTNSRLIKVSRSSEGGGYISGSEREIANINTPPGPSKPLEKKQIYQNSSFIKSEKHESSEDLLKQSILNENNDLLVYDDVDTSSKYEVSHEQSHKKTLVNNESSGYVSGSEREVANNIPPGPSKCLEKEKTYQHSNFIKSEKHESSEDLLKQSIINENNEFLVYDDVDARYGVTHEQEEHKKNSVSVSRQREQVSSQGSSKAIVTKNYLRQIKQHSREIATIKRMLKQKINMEPQKPDTKTILNELQHHIPFSLFSIVSLLLGEKNELNDEDIEFFTSLHRTSPEVYQLLSEKYKWNLPSVDVVDASSE